jgi:hypothetical protein
VACLQGKSTLAVLACVWTFFLFSVLRAVFPSHPERALGTMVLPSVIGRSLLEADYTDFAVPYRLSKLYRFGDAAPHFTFPR